jgi:KDO2-lipid IV(A) lauroyltransferase
MQALLFYLSLPFIYGISILPFWVLYRLSDILFILLYYVTGYRRKVVITNLRNAFPEKTEEEIRQISRKFYRHFSDITVENLKALTMTEKTLRKIVRFEDTAMFEDLYEKGQSFIFVLGHLGNWELAGSRFNIEPFHHLYAIYHPLKNEYFESLVYHMRTRFGLGLYTMKGTLRGVLKNRSEITGTAFIADQTPVSPNVHWMEFLHQDTPVFAGAEKIAKKFKYPVVYMSMPQLKRGQYLLRPELIAAHPEQTAENEITEAFIRRLEQDIWAQPEIWLWTHRRWKRQRVVKEQSN